MLYNMLCYVIYMLYMIFIYVICIYNMYIFTINILEIKYSGCIYSVQAMKVIIIITLQITGGKTHQKQHSSKALKPLI